MGKPIPAARGMRDVLPDEQRYWSMIRQLATKRLQSFGFQPIDTPIVEARELFVRGTGQGTDIVEKELFGVHRTGTRLGSENAGSQESEYVLRPEATPGIVRAYIEHGMRTWPQPVKLYTFSQHFRYDRPQKGRYRQHTQLSVEILGDETPLTDAMTLLALWQILQDLGLDRDSEIALNSIGDEQCRPKIREALVAYYTPLASQLCANCQRRLTQNPLRLLDCKEPQCQPFKAAAPQVIDQLCQDCRAHFMLVLEYLDEAGVPYDLNPQLVRGLDYYTRTTFEIRDRTTPQTAQNSVAGGGRYDGLVELLGGPATTAFGFGMGMERVIEMMRAKQLPVQQELRTEVLIIQLGGRAKKKAIPLLVSLSKKGLAVSMALGKESLKAQLRSADKMGARLALIVGEREAIDGTIIVRNMRDSTQETIDFDDVEQVVKKRLTEPADE